MSGNGTTIRAQNLGQAFIVLQRSPDVLQQVVIMFYRERGTYTQGHMEYTEEVFVCPWSVDPPEPGKWVPLADVRFR